MMQNPITAPTRRRSWTTFHMVERVINLMQTGIPLDEIAECLLALGVRADRVDEILRGQTRGAA